MVRAKGSELADPDAASDYYEQRYQSGYIDEWPESRKQRLGEVIRGMRLPSSGTALDFGCGNGVLTEVLRNALPSGWKVVGGDISDTAVANGRARFPKCSFERLEQFRSEPTFDLVFTHHVLEHVHDIEAIVASISDLVLPGGAMLHVLPCGNAGSFEHQLCSMQRNGIETERESRFFFEEEGHLRRLTSERLAGLFARHGFTLQRGWFANQRHGAIDWMTQAPPAMLDEALNPSTAINDDAARRIRAIRRQIRTLRTLRLPTMVLRARQQRGLAGPKDVVIAGVGLALSPISRPVDAWIRKRADREWNERSQDTNGSEMFLWFQRVGAQPTDRAVDAAAN